MRGHAWIGAAVADMGRLAREMVLRPKATPPLDLRSRSGSVRAPRRRPGGVAPTRTATPSARELFPHLRARLLESRPVVGWRDELDPERREPIYGEPTFRNVIDESGRHV